jgi:hypothetical protein
MELITASLARLSAAQEQDRMSQAEALKRHDSLLGRLAETQTKVAELIAWQSQRMDHMDKIYEETLSQNDSFQKQAIHLLNMILDRLPKPDFPH